MPQFVSDGFVSLLGGCNAGLAPTLLPAHQFASGINISCRDGLVRTRPGFVQKKVLGTGLFQGAETYRLNDTDRIVFGLSGVVYVYNLTTGGIANIGTMDATAPTFWFAQVDRFMVVQDGINRPLIIHEDALYRRARNYRHYDGSDGTANEIFTGTVTKFGHGRIFTSAIHIHGNDGQPDPTTQGRPYFVAGDIMKASDPDAVLKFTETTYLNGGGAAGMPSEYGFITGMGFFRNVQSGTGWGPLIVFAKNGVSAFNVHLPRAGWQNTDFSQILFSDIGTISHRSIVPFNDDLLFRAFDGLRSLRYTTSQVAAGSGALSSTPISHEVEPWLEMDQLTDLPFSSIAFVNNRMFLTTGGRTGPGFNAITSLDTAASYGVSSQPVPPAYDGIWTGGQFLQIMRAEVNGDRVLVALFDNEGTTELWYLDEAAYLDNNVTPILCRVVTRTFDFGNLRSLKKFSHVDVWVRDLRGDAELTAYYRPEGYALWNGCNTASLTATYGSGAALPQRRYRIRLAPDSDTVYDPSTGIHVGQGNNFQLCLEWTGALALEKVVVNAVVTTEEPGVCCEEFAEAVALVEGPGGILLDDFTYHMV
jgi:hypothetical protein